MRETSGTGSGTKKKIDIPVFIEELAKYIKKKIN